MNHNGSTTTQRTDLLEPVRNRYFYGKLMDVHSFELETGYFLAMQRLLNRYVTGYGVVCGLDVLEGEEENSVVVTRGMAIDKWGRVILVPTESRAITVPEHLLPTTPRPTEPPEEAAPRRRSRRQQQQQQWQEPPHGEEEDCVHRGICYYACESDPTPVLTSDCESWGTCEAGAIRERYYLEFRKGEVKPPNISIENRFPDVIRDGRLDYEELVRWVTDSCPDYPKDPCIPLANIHLVVHDDKCRFEEEGIDIAVRPIVYTNDLLFDLLMALLTENVSYRRGK
ncbi:MAG: hypothetical protein GX484_05810 [Chloroflexi bacterium]|nr:hypothetical protein [Chloroflexota bacterium]